MVAGPCLSAERQLGDDCCHLWTQCCSLHFRCHPSRQDTFLFCNVFLSCRVTDSLFLSDWLYSEQPVYAPLIETISARLTQHTTTRSIGTRNVLLCRWYSFFGTRFRRQCVS